MSSDLYITDPEKWLQETIEAHDLVCILFFRGSWCKYDRYYLKELGKFYQNQLKAGGDEATIIAWTSEGAEGAKKMDEDLKLTTELGFAQVLGDETNALAKYFKDFLKEEEILGDLDIVDVKTLKADDDIKKSPSTYPTGLASPCILWYAHKGMLVLEWASANNGGPGRPDCAEMWAKVQKRKHALEKGNVTMPAHKNIKLCADDWQVTLSQCVLL